jgi:hypothetical protein
MESSEAEKGKIPLNEFIFQIHSIPDFDVAYVAGIDVQNKVPATLFVKAFMFEAWEIVYYLLTQYPESALVIHDNMSCLSHLVRHLLLIEEIESIPEEELKHFQNIVERNKGLVNLGQGSLWTLLFSPWLTKWTKTAERIALILVQNGAQIRTINFGLGHWRIFRDYYKIVEECCKSEICFPVALSRIIFDYLQHPVCSVFTHKLHVCLPQPGKENKKRIKLEVEIFERFVAGMWPEIGVDPEVLAFSENLWFQLLRAKRVKQG